MPAHGSTSCDSVAAGALTISVPSGPESYLVKISDASGGLVCRVVIGGGRSVTVGIPEGTYYLTYGAGTKWYGYSLAFGPEGSYSAAQENFPFESGTHWEVELILQPGGNLGTSGLGYEDF